MKKNTLKNLIIIFLAVLASAAIFFFMPVPVTIFEKTQGAKVTPFGEILPDKPLNQCASDISDYGKYGEIRLEPYLALYNRLNTAHYILRVFVRNGNDEVVMHEEAFSAAGLEDNSYKAFAFTPRSTIPGTLCFTLKTSDAAPGNAVTVWLNGEGAPVYKITAFEPLFMMPGRIATTNIFGLGRDVLFGLFFVYLAVQIWLIIYLAGKAYELEKNPKPAHSKRTGKSGV